MDDLTKFPPVVDLSSRTKLFGEGTNPQHPFVFEGAAQAPTNAGRAYKEPAPPAHLSPYPTKES